MAFATWLLSLHTRGRSVPAAGRYALRVVSEELAFNIPATSPAALSATRSHVIKLAKQAPCFAHHMLLTFERLAADRGSPVTLGYFASFVMFMVIASSRFANTKHIRGITFGKHTAAGPFLPTEDLKGFFNGIPRSHVSSLTGPGTTLLPTSALVSTRAMDCP